MKLFTFLQESKAELAKVVWPKREEVVNSTIVVLITVVIFSLFLFASDRLFVSLLNYLWKLAG